jgi:hypothetical protein
MPVLTPVISATHKKTAPQHHGRIRLFVLLTLLVLCVGALEDWYGRTNQGALYGSDAVQYLDSARALHLGDWKLAVSPIWGLGYPLLVAAADSLFPQTMAGELFAIRVLNLCIFIATYIAFLYLIAGLLKQKTNHNQRLETVLMIGGAGLFITLQVATDQVSRVGPDQLISALFLFSCGLLLRLIATPAWKHALLLGAAMGFGYITKTIFLPIGCILLAVLAISIRQKKQTWSYALAAVIVFFAFVTSYATAMSAAFGRPTLGESGSLNYAWHVNRLAKWVHWEGGCQSVHEAWPNHKLARFSHWESNPPEFGHPIHPTQHLSAQPAIINFSEPFHVTYPPYYNPPYWYEGYRHFWNWRYQTIALGVNSFAFFVLLISHPFLYAIAAIFLILLCSLPKPTSWRHWMKERWPLWTVALLSIALYLPIHLEGRYLSSFLLALFTIAFFGLLDLHPGLSKTKQFALIGLLSFGLLAEIAGTERSLLTHHPSYKADSEWQAAQQFAPAGLPPGSRIGVLAWEPTLHCDWAYLADLHITAEVETPEGWKDFWALSPSAQQAFLEQFRTTKATAVVLWGHPGRDGALGWKEVGNTPAWIHFLNSPTHN